MERSMDLGLRRGTVRLSEHSPTWSSTYDDVAAALLEVTGIPPARIEHAGSTSVPGLVAKPILDIVIGLTESESGEETAGRLVELGYIDRGTGTGSIGRLLVWESSPDVRAVHVHIVGYRTRAWRDYVDFRDALRHDPATRERYARLKQTLARRFVEDRKSYRNEKDRFIEKTLDTLRSS